MGESKKVVQEVNTFLQTLDLKKYGANFHLTLAGGYTKKVQQQAMLERDLKIATLVALCLVLAFLSFHFRRPTAIVAVIVPLIIGVCWCFGFAAATFGSLNILTSFIGAVLLGMGIDHGIHLLGHFDEECIRGSSQEDAIVQTFSGTGKAAAIAAMTTAAAFLGISFSEFRAFREFGVIAGGGMFLLLFAYGLILPLMVRFLPEQKAKVTAHESGGFAKLLVRSRILLAALTIIVSGISVLGLGQWEFDYNFNHLEPTELESFKLDKVIDRVLKASQTPVVVLTEGVQDEREVAAALRERKASKGDASTIKIVTSGAEFVPDQLPEKFKIIKKMRDLLENVEQEDLKENEQKEFARVRKMTRAEPFQYQDLPVEVRRQFGAPDAKASSGFVLIYPAFDFSDGSMLDSFSKEVSQVKTKSGRAYSPAGEPMILADILNMVKRESPPAMALTLFFVFTLSWILLGSLKGALFTLLPAFLTMLISMGLLFLTSIRINYLNLVMVPVLFGLSVDGGAHLTFRFLYTNDSLVHSIRETGRNIASAIFTTALGFSAMLLADHQGLNSLGSFALFGLAANLFACLIALPAFLAFLRNPVVGENA